MCFRPAEASLNDHNICDACGTENPPGETICSNCGGKLVKKEILDAPTGTNVAAPPPVPGMSAMPEIPKPAAPRARR